jgi:hypothetical protein
VHQGGRTSREFAGRRLSRRVPPRPRRSRRRRRSASRGSRTARRLSRRRICLCARGCPTSISAPGQRDRCDEHRDQQQHHHEEERRQEGGSRRCGGDTHIDAVSHHPLSECRVRGGVSHRRGAAVPGGDDGKVCIVFERCGSNRMAVDGAHERGIRRDRRVPARRGDCRRAACECDNHGSRQRLRAESPCRRSRFGREPMVDIVHRATRLVCIGVREDSQRALRFCDDLQVRAVSACLLSSNVSAASAACIASPITLGCVGTMASRAPRVIDASRPSTTRLPAPLACLLAGRHSAAPRF